MMANNVISKNEPLLEVRHLSKNYGATLALKDISLTVKRGVVCGLIGENGSGKSTLSSIVAGINTASSGEMYIEGELWNPTSALMAQKNGVSIIVQEAGTIPNITVAENIFLGHEKMFSKGSFVSRSKMFAEAQKLLEFLGVEGIRAEAMIDSLDMQARKIVEIAKALYWKPKIFIVDETTTSLSQTGRMLLYRLMKELTENGGTVLFISHDLEEVMEQCDVLVVLRDGDMVGTLEKSDFNADTIKKMMVGREIKGDYYRADMDGYSNEIVLKADCITTLSDLLCFDIELHKGEILGIGGISDCGMHTLGRALFGIEKILDGQVRLANGTIISSSKIAIANKMGYISKNRDRESLSMTATIRENIASTGYKLNRVFGPIISFKKEKKYVDNQINDLSIKCASQYYTVNTLSGGNKQKVAFGKWIAADADILIMDCPTRGVDIGVKAAMYKLIYEMKKAGKSIVLISEELPELIGMSDRIVIMKKGEISYEIKRNEVFDEHKLIMHML